MKILFVSLVFLAFAHSVQADSLALNQSQSKELYNVLTGFDLPMAYPAEKLSREWAHPAICMKGATGGVPWLCKLGDKLHHTKVQRTGAVAEKLFNIIKSVNGADCEADGFCITRTEDIKCTRRWRNLNTLLRRRYFCTIDQISAGLNIYDQQGEKNEITTH